MRERCTFLVLFLRYNKRLKSKYDPQGKSVLSNGLPTPSVSGSGQYKVNGSVNPSVKRHLWSLPLAARCGLALNCFLKTISVRSMLFCKCLLTSCHCTIQPMKIYLQDVIFFNVSDWCKLGYVFLFQFLVTGLLGFACAKKKTAYMVRMYSLFL